MECATTTNTWHCFHLDRFICNTTNNNADQMPQPNVHVCVWCKCYIDFVSKGVYKHNYIVRSDNMDNNDYISGSEPGLPTKYRLFVYGKAFLRYYYYCRHSIVMVLTNINRCRHRPYMYLWCYIFNITFSKLNYEGVDLIFIYTYHYFNEK